MTEQGNKKTDQIVNLAGAMIFVLMIITVVNFAIGATKGLKEGEDAKKQAFKRMEQQLQQQQEQAEQLKQRQQQLQLQQQQAR